MPPKKQQKTTRAAAAKAKDPEPQDQDDQGQDSLPHKTDKNTKKGTSNKLKKRDVNTIPDDEYICTIRPLFDYKAEHWAKKGGAADEDKLFKKYAKEGNAEINACIVNQPAKDFPDRKWVMQWETYKHFKDYQRRAKYCDPDRFNMYIYNDFEGWGFQELLENMVNAFKAALNKKDNLSQVWAIISGIGWWLNEVDQGPLIGNEDGEKTCDLTRLLGYTLLRGLAAIDQADQLTPDSKFLDIPLVITMWLYWSADLPAYGIEGESVDWRPHVAAYFKKANFDPSKGISGTKKLLDKIKDADLDAIPSKNVKDPWGWKEKLRKYTSHNSIGGKIGGTRHDITLMSSAQRASHAYDKKDPLKDIPVKVLKEGLLDWDS